jgi:hypothetical protein
MIASAPPAAVVRGGAKKAAEMTAMETMPAGEEVTGTVVAAQSAATVAAAKAATTVAATADTDQDQRAASCIQCTDQAASTDRFGVTWSYPLCAATTDPAA